MKKCIVPSVCDWIIVVSFGLCVFITNVFFYWSAFHSILVSSIWKEPIETCIFYLAKFVPSMVLMGILLATKRKSWSIVFLALLEVWCIANILYYEFFNLFVSIDDVLLIGNMNGMWKSLLPCLDYRVWGYLIILLLYIVIYYVVTSKCNQNTNRCILLSIVLLVMSYASLVLVNRYRINNWYDKHTSEEMAFEALIHQERNLYKPFVLLDVFGIFTDNWSVQYVKAQSISAYFVASCIQFNKTHIFDKPELTNQDISAIHSLINENPQETPKYNLLLILVESLESWPIFDTIQGNIITPNINNFIQNHNVLYCSRIASQIRKGGSGDGQMIINTGILPLQDGVACMNFGRNIYPNFAHMFSKSVILNPTPQIWNQSTVAYSYGYTDMIEPNDDHTWIDSEMFQVLDSVVDNFKYHEEPSCVMAITMTSHSPFERPDNMDINFSSDMPVCLSNYLNCINYVDSCMYNILSNDELLSNTIVVITSDHNIFKDAMLSEYMNYVTENDFMCKEGHTYCPLIVYSPDFTQEQIKESVFYQMDIYPTILGAMNVSTSWKGFGINLLEQNLERTISEDEAFRLSNGIIKNNAFNDIISLKNE